MSYKYIYEATLLPDTETYVTRDADSQLYAALKEGKYCHVFNSRKTGKSSLRVQVMNRLKAEQIHCIFIDVSPSGSQSSSPDKWYNGILLKLNEELSPSVNLKQWNNEYDWLLPIDRLSEFVKTVLLKNLPNQIIIFIDEIDRLLSLDSIRDDFFAYIRSCYNLRADNLAYQRLTFCLLGVATPSDLIKDTTRTPYNIGQAIELKGFTPKEAAPVLTKGLEGKFGNNSTAILEQIIKLTGGQPFLTQKLCQRVLEYAEIDKPNIDEIAQTYIIDNWEAQDNPELLRTIRNRLISEQVQNRSGRLLSIYQQILTNGQIPADNSPDQMELQLTGLVVKDNGHLKVYNPIYKEVFNLNWVQQQLANLRPYQENFQAWIESDKKDDSRLLRGESLTEALNWKEGKRLSDDDTAFFDASQRYQIEILRQAEAKAKEIIKAAQEGTKIERAGVQALRRFNTKTGQFQALREAKKAGEDLQKLLETWENLVKDNSELAADSPAASPLLALQTILSKIRERHTFIGHNDSLISVSLSADGKFLATGSYDNTAKLWSTETSAALHIFTGHTGWVTSVSLSADGKFLATGSADYTAKLWSTETSAALDTFTGHTDSVTSVSLSADGKFLATGSDDNTAKLWSTETSAALDTFTGHTDSVTSVSLSADGKFLATGSADNTAKLSSTETKELLHTFTGHTNSVTSVSLSADGKFLATGSAYYTILWSIETLPKIHTFTDHTGWVTSVSLSGDGKFLATGSEGNTAKLWSTETKELLHTFTGHNNCICSVSLSGDGKFLATGSADYKAKLWSTKISAALHTFTSHTNPVRSVSFSSDGKYLATGSDDKTAKLWSIETLTEIHTFTGHTNSVRSVSFSPDGKYLATGSWDKTAKLWSIETLAEIHTFTGHTNPVSSVSFNSDGKYLATGSYDNTAKLWSIETLAEIHSFTGHTDWVTSVSFSPDGKYLATVSEYSIAKLWSIETLAEIHTFTGHTNLVSSISFSSDGKYLATGSDDNTAKLWSIETKAEIHTFTGHTDSVTSVSFSSDGKYLATGSFDNTAKLWDLSGNLIADFIGYEDRWQFIEIESRVFSVCFSPDGKYLAAGYGDGVVRLWPIENLNQLLARAREWLQLD
ncbi:AAA-like domain-containing protein [Kamptonema animale CS-326]|uniref:WD40 domain-containing protein n=1 Tax=Kamptonema animale TaxID=92934 RepID=UPI00232B4887|nr:AAA-like domain-containing protein [Kamptonema animale]MDB9509710.1 AAA-like domain-containing protein [Kamptonema animale CS-326]